MPLPLPRMNPPLGYDLALDSPQPLDVALAGQAGLLPDALLHAGGQRPA